MHPFSTTFAGLFLVYATVITTVYAVDLRGVQLSREELLALTRDHFGRSDPDLLLDGFFPVWAAIIFLISCFFGIVAIISTICYLLGCRGPKENVRIRQT